MDAPRYSLPVFATISEAWHKVKGSKTSVWGACGWLWLISFCLSLVAELMANIPLVDSLLGVLNALRSLLLGILIPGTMLIGIRVARDKDFRASLVFYPYTRGLLLLKLLGFWFLCFLVSVVPVTIAVFSSIFLFQTPPPDISPGAKLGISLIDVIFILLTLYLMIRIRYGWAFILDQDFGPWNALKASFRITRNNFWRIVAIYFLNLLILLVSLIPLGIGIIWSVPYCFISYGIVYRKLLEGQEKY